MITLQFKEIRKDFANTDELREFVQLQRDSWSWLQKIGSRDRSLNQLRNAYYEYLNRIDNFLNQYEQYKDHKDQQDSAKKELLNQTQRAISKGFFLNESSQAKFVAELKEKTNPLVAAYALIFLAEQDISPDINAIGPAVEGVYWALQFLQGNTDTVKVQQDALESMKRNWDVRFGEYYDNLKLQNDQFIKEATELKSKHNDLIKSFETEIEESKKRLKDIEHTYDEKLALQSSVKYWGDKRNHHQKIMFLTGGITLFLALVTIGAFLWVAFEFSEDTITQVSLWKLSIMLVISSFGVWITRLMAKIFISNLHLRTDSHERTTMIQTYLALLQEGKGPKDEERQLILQTLFRPSTTGFIKEDGPAGFYETISKAFGK